MHRVSKFHHTRAQLQHSAFFGTQQPFGTAIVMLELHSPRSTARIEPACNIGPSLPITSPLATARALPMTFAMNVLMVKKFLEGHRTHAQFI